MTRLTLRDAGLSVLVITLAVGWGIDHVRLSRQPDCDCNLEMLKQRALFIPQGDIMQSKFDQPQPEFSIPKPDAK